MKIKGIPLRNILVRIPFLPFLLVPYLRRHSTFCVNCFDDRGRDKHLFKGGELDYWPSNWWRCYFLGHSAGGR